MTVVCQRYGPPMQAAIIIFPGSNREHDVCLAWKLATGRDPLRVWHGDASLPETDLIILPGGFAHGDYLRCGAMARSGHGPSAGSRCWASATASRS